MHKALGTLGHTVVCQLDVASRSLHERAANMRTMCVRESSRFDLNCHVASKPTYWELIDGNSQTAKTKKYSFFLPVIWPLEC